MNKNSITKELLSEKYDELYQRASRTLEVVKPCNIKPGGECVIGEPTCKSNFASCNGTRAYKEISGPHLCCQAFKDEDGDHPVCEHWKDGCTVEALHCKLWICPVALPIEATNINPSTEDVAGKTRIPFECTPLVAEGIFREAEKFKLLHFRCSKEQALEKAWEEWQDEEK